MPFAGQSGTGTRRLALPRASSMRNGIAIFARPPQSPAEGELAGERRRDMRGELDGDLRRRAAVRPDRDVGSDTELETRHDDDRPADLAARLVGVAVDRLAVEGDVPAGDLELEVGGERRRAERLAALVEAGSAPVVDVAEPRAARGSRDASPGPRGSPSSSARTAPARRRRAPDGRRAAPRRFPWSALLAPRRRARRTSRCRPASPARRRRSTAPARASPARRRRARRRRPRRRARRRWR